MHEPRQRHVGLSRLPAGQVGRRQLRWAPAPPRERRPFWRDFAGGLLFGLQNVLLADLRRPLVSPEQQGRFFGLQGSLNQALSPVGMAAAGVLSDWFSPYAVAAGAGFVVVALAISGLTGPGLRDIP